MWTEENLEITNKRDRRVGKKKVPFIVSDSGLVMIPLNLSL